MPDSTPKPLIPDRPLRVVLAIDVEEEGLFSGHYPRQNLSVTNVDALRRLAPLTAGLGFPPTLLCTHAVLAEARARCTVLEVARQLGAEIGAHLHHWHTPPMAPAPTSPGADLVPDEVMAARLATLLDLAGEVRGRPVASFRQGRWDLRPGLWPVLARAGVQVDSSIHPLRFPRGGPDHFMAPTQPFRVAVEGREILEMPIGVVPLVPGLDRFVHGLATGRGPGPGHGLLRTFPHWGVMALKPVWHGLTYLQTATRMLVRQGATVLSLTWHSSEMQAGCCPHLPGQDDVDRLLRRIRLFLEWLTRTFPVRGLTLEGLSRENPPFPLLGRTAAAQAGDWCPRHLVDPTR